MLVVQCSFSLTSLPTRPNQKHKTPQWHANLPKRPRSYYLILDPRVLSPESGSRAEASTSKQKQTQASESKQKQTKAFKSKQKQRDLVTNMLPVVLTPCGEIVLRRCFAQRVQPESHSWPGSRMGFLGPRVDDGRQQMLCTQGEGVPLCVYRPGGSIE